MKQSLIPSTRPLNATTFEGILRNSDLGSKSYFSGVSMVTVYRMGLDDVPNLRMANGQRGVAHNRLSTSNTAWQGRVQERSAKSAKSKGN